MAATFFWIATGSVAMAFVTSFIRTYRQNTNNNRWQLDQADWRSRRDERYRNKLIGQVEAYFPFLKDEIRSALRESKRPIEAIRDALSKADGVVVGIGPFRLPIPIARKVRTRHAAVVGFTGSGKTSLQTRVSAYGA